MQRMDKIHPVRGVALLTLLLAISLGACAPEGGGKPSMEPPPPGQAAQQSDKPSMTPPMRDEEAEESAETCGEAGEQRQEEGYPEVHRLLSS